MKRGKVPEKVFENFNQELKRVLSSLDEIPRDQNDQGLKDLPPMTDSEKSAVGALFATVLKLMKESDIMAVERMDELTQNIKGRIQEDKLSKVLRQAENLDFDSATGLLYDIAKDMNLEIRE